VSDTTDGSDGPGAETGTGTEGDGTAPDVAVVERIEDLPESLPAATYVIVDVYRFSTSVVALLEAGATGVMPAGSPAAVREYKRSTPEAVVGGEPYQSDPLFGLSNSPTEIADADVDGRPTCLYSENGARAVGRVADAGPVYVGTSWNLAAVADAVRDDPSVRIVATGAGGEVRYEDTTVAYAIERSILDGPLTGSRLETYRLAIEGVNSRHSTSGRDAADAEMLTEFDRSTVVPRLTDAGVLAESGE